VVRVALAGTGSRTQRRNRGRTLPVALDQHRAALALCRRCALEDAHARPVLSEARRPLAMLVGQAPGKVEIVDRRPFAGRAGRTLFRWFAEVGIDEATIRSRVYIAAITRCYPGPSPSGRGDRVPSPRERALCSDWLETELRLIEPPVLIPVGRLAIERFLPALPLDRLVGARHHVRHEGGEAIAIPLPHPSGASSWVNKPENRALVRRALGLIADALPELVTVASTPAGGQAS
jgi:uracil-DNA glycosylase